MGHGALRLQDRYLGQEPLATEGAVGVEHCLQSAQLGRPIPDLGLTVSSRPGQS